MTLFITNNANSDAVERFSSDTVVVKYTHHRQQQEIKVPLPRLGYSFHHHRRSTASTAAPLEVKRLMLTRNVVSGVVCSEN
jgi:hypothetical protein